MRLLQSSKLGALSDPSKVPELQHPDVGLLLLWW